jgi:HK97 family phage major capsid protein
MPEPTKGAAPDPVDRVDSALRNIESTVATLKEKTDKVDEIEKLVNDNVRSLEEWKQKNAARPERFNIGGKENGRKFSIGRLGAVALSMRHGASPESAYTKNRAEFERDTLAQFYEEHNVRAMANSPSDAAGGFLVPEGVLGFGNILRAQSVCFRLGAEEVLTNSNPLVWNRQSGSATVAYSAEGATVSASDLTLQQVSLQPRSAKALVRVSRELIERGDPAVDSIVKNDLLRILALNVDKQAMIGPQGASAPTGIVATSGVGSDTTAATSTTALAILVQKVKTANGIVEGKLGWAMHPVMEQRIMQLGPTTTLPIYMNPNQGYAAENVPILGAPYATTTQLAASNGTAGTCQILFGDWSQLKIVRWKPGLEIRFSFDRYFDTNEVGILGVDAHDILVKQAGSFAFNNSLTS